MTNPSGIGVRELRRAWIGHLSRSACAACAAHYGDRLGRMMGDDHVLRLAVTHRRDWSAGDARTWERSKAILEAGE